MQNALIDTSFRCDEIVSRLTEKQEVKLYMARLDEVHPVVSGNKLFKLHYFMEEAEKKQSAVLSFGGPHSNHLVALAWYAQKLGLACTGMVRGESPKQWSETLKECAAYGMTLRFISREAYSQKTNPEYQQTLMAATGTTLLIPEGGFHYLGAKGAARIMNQLNHLSPTHVCTAIGTATTYAGLLMNAGTGQQIVGIPVIKNMQDVPQRIAAILPKEKIPPLLLWQHETANGFGKWNQELLDFMNEWFVSHQIPTDFVYTAKMMMTILSKISSGAFPAGSTIICLHTGGLQGNRGLPQGSLIF